MKGRVASAAAGILKTKSRHSGTHAGRLASLDLATHNATHTHSDQIRLSFRIEHKLDRLAAWRSSLRSKSCQQRDGGKGEGRSQSSRGVTYTVGFEMTDNWRGNKIIGKRNCTTAGIGTFPS